MKITMDNLESNAEMLQVDHFDWGNDMLVNLFPLWKGNILCDTTIICENDEKIQAHSILLAAASPSLYSFLRNSDQGTYEFQCTTVPLSIWKNVVTFIYTGRIDIAKEDMVPTYNLANKLAMFNFSKELAVQLKEHGLVRGGNIKTPVPSVASNSDSSPEKSEVESRHPEEEDQQPASETHGQSEYDEQLQTLKASVDMSSTIDHMDSNPDIQDTGETSPSTADFLSMDLVSDEPYFMPSDFDVDVNVASDSEETTAISEHRFECPICFLSFKRLSALKKHRTFCIGKSATKPQQAPLKKVPPLKISTKLKGLSNSSTVPKSVPEKGNTDKKQHHRFRAMYYKTDDGKFMCKLCEDSPTLSYTGINTHIKVKHLGMARPKINRKKAPVESTSSGSSVPVPDESDVIAGSLSPELLQYYVPVMHNSSYKIKCKVCRKLMRKRASFVMHVKMHHLNSQRGGNKLHDKTTAKGLPAGVAMPLARTKVPRNELYPCHLCSRTFCKKMHLGSHMRIHNPMSATAPTQTKKSKLSKLYKKLEVKK